MIPKILVTNDTANSDALIRQFVLDNNIKLSNQIEIIPEKNELTVEQIHLLQKDIQVQFSEKILVVIHGLDESSNEVQNSLLKSIEEDSGRISFLFLVKNPSRLLSTIISRCSLIDPIKQSPVESIDNISDFFSLQNISDVTKGEAVMRIDRYIDHAGLSRGAILKHILTMRKLIIDNNINPVLALDNILIFLTKTSTMDISHENKK